MSKKTIRDTFFFNPKQALKIAKQQNKLTISETPHKWSLFETDLPTQKRQEFYNDLQICYYPGKQLEGNDIPENCINVPFDSVFDFFKESRLRYPELVNFKGIGLNKTEKKNCIKLFKIALENSAGYKNKKTRKYAEIIKDNKPNFNEPLRFFLMANRFTTVLQYVQKDIGRTLKDMGYNVMVSIEENNMESLHHYIHLKKFADFNPHVVISINHMNNQYLNDEIFNFVWYQDPMPILMNQDKMLVRKRDVIFTLSHQLDDALIKNKKIRPSKRQKFCINTKRFFKDTNIQREDKIIFVGSSYKDSVSGVPQSLVTKIADLFINGIDFTENIIQNIITEYKIDRDGLTHKIIPFVVRDIAVIQLCTDVNYKIEIYGQGWDTYEQVKPFYKGILKYGEELNNIYNSAKYSFAPHSDYILQQRILESASAGCIPIAFDCRYKAEPPFYEDSIIFFKKIADLNNILKSNPKKDLKRVLKDHSYKHLAKRLLRTVSKGINE